MEGSTYTVQLENFAGPLDLLLQLIERQKLDICDISLSKVTSDYLASIQDIELDQHQANWFLDIASKLILHKSRALLPGEQNAETEELQDLAEQLQELAAIRAAARALANAKTTNLVFRKKSPNQIKSTIYPNLDLSSFGENYPKPRKKTQTKTFKLKRQNPIYLRQKIQAMWEKQKRLNIDSLHTYTESRYETVVCFLLALEKLKTNQAKMGVENTTVFVELI